MVVGFLSGISVSVSTWTSASLRECGEETDAQREGSMRCRSALTELGFPSGAAKKVPLGFTASCDLAAALLMCGVDTDALVVGELSLAGHVRHTRGVLPMVEAAASAGVKRAIVPNECLRDAMLVDGISIIGVGTLSEAVEAVNADDATASVAPYQVTGFDVDLSDVYSDPKLVRAMEVAATVGHRLALLGPPGCGQVMLARRFVTIMPSLSSSDFLETAGVYSVAGLPLPAGRPFRAPHHTVSEAGLVGTARHYGEVSLAHNGVLLLDELCEFRAAVTESLFHAIASNQRPSFVWADVPDRTGGLR